MEGAGWRVLRRFVLSTLKNLGAGPGRLDLDDLIQEKSSDFVAEISQTKQQPFSPRQCIERATVGALSSVVHRGQLTPDDARFPRLMQAYTEIFSASFNTNLLSTTPWLRFVPPFRNHYLMIKRGMDDVALFARDAIKEKKKEDLDFGPARDFVDAFRAELAKPDHHEAFTGTADFPSL